MLLLFIMIFEKKYVYYQEENWTFYIDSQWKKI